MPEEVMKKVILTYVALSLAAILMLITMACSSTSKATQLVGQVETVSPDQFKQGLQQGNVQLVDVRSAEEYAEGHLEGAVNIDVQEPEFQAETSRELQKEKKVYVYCRSGRRSLLAGEMLAKDGFTVVDLDGGILAWIKAGLPVVK